MQRRIKQKTGLPRLAVWLTLASGLLFGLAATVSAAAAEAEAEPAPGAETKAPAAGKASTAKREAPAADSRPALFPSQETLPSSIGTPNPPTAGAPSLDSYQWLDATKKDSLLVVRKAHGPEAAGVALLLSADPAAHSTGSFIGQLRGSLPASDWHSYLQSLPLPPRESSGAAVQNWHNKVQQRISAALALIAQTHTNLPIVVVGEGRVCLPLAALESLAADGLVLLNQPLPRGVGLLAEVAQPTLLLQVLPNRLPKGYSLAAMVEARNLPRLSPRQPKSLLLRQVRGWLRQFEDEPVIPLASAQPRISPNGSDATLALGSPLPS